MTTSEEVQKELIQSVVEFTGTSSGNAAKLLLESDWNVPEAVTRFFLQVDASSALNNRQRGPPPQQEWSVLGTFVSGLASAIKSCMGWAWESCYRACRLLFLNPLSRPVGSGNLNSHFSSFSPRPRCFEGSFQEAAAFSRQTDCRKVLVIFLHSSSASDLDSALTSLCNESIVDIINSQFVFWTGDSDFPHIANFMRAFPIRSPPALIAVVSTNRTELKIVGACAGSTSFNSEGIMNVLQKAQEAQDRLIIEDEQFKSNRALREAQDLEYQEALERDALLEAQRERDIKESLSRKQAADTKCINSKNTKQELFEKFSLLPPPKTSTTIVIRLPDGIRIERNFDISDTVATLYEWVLCAGHLYPHATRVVEEIHPGSFSLSTSFPSKKLDDMNVTLEDLQLYPNAVLLFTRLYDESENEIDSK